MPHSDIADLMRTIRWSDEELRFYFFPVAEWLRAQNANSQNFDPDLICQAQEIFGCTPACVIRIAKILGVNAETKVL